MKKDVSCHKKEYLHNDATYGLNDWEPAVAFVRGLLDNTEDEQFCFPAVRKRVLENNSLLSQTFVQHLGFMRDQRGIGIIKAKLEQLEPDNLSLKSPWSRGGRYLETLCLESLALIGGPEVVAIVQRYRDNPEKAYLSEALASLKIATQPRNNVATYHENYPEILKGIRSIHEVLGEGGEYTSFDSERTEKTLQAWRSLKWTGPIEFLSGDGRTTTFKLKTKISDHIHDLCDPFSDFGIFMSKPKIEYPIGRHRWANSHTFLCFPVADGALYDSEFTWNLENNTITTHFHEHIDLEEVAADQDGMTVRVSRTPISTGVELRSNVFSKQCSSAVRGIWDNPEKKGENYYAKRANVLLPYKELYYFCPLHKPIVNQWGIWLVDESEKPERFFDGNGNCLDIDGVIDQLLIPLHEPKVLAWTLEQYQPNGARDRFAKRLPSALSVDLAPVPPATLLDPVLGTAFEHGKCAYTGIRKNIDNGYKNGLDINADGVIDEKDRQILAEHAGDVYRMNVGDYGYFGFNWLSIGHCPRSKNLINERALFICSYDYGAGYNCDTGVVNLCKKALPGQKLYIEYLHDAPAAAGKDNIKVYLHSEL
jgi:hypothetical protein